MQSPSIVQTLRDNWLEESYMYFDRDAAWCAAWQVTAEFNQINGLVLVCRAHQLVQEGLKYMFQGALAGSRTTPCAPSYCCSMQPVLSCGMQASQAPPLLAAKG